MGVTWELDFYSRPLLDDEEKKVWEVLICESPQSVQQLPEDLFRYSQYCPSSTVNSVWLRQAIEAAITEAGQMPQKIRFFRRQMNNMISKACEEAGIPPVPSRRTYVLEQWLDDRLENFYPHQPGYDPKLASSTSVQYPELNAIALPDAVRGDRGDQWALVSLAAADFNDLPDWEISFGESFPLSPYNLPADCRIPGLILFSPRALPFAAWLSGLELGYLQYNTDPRPIVRLETGASDSWIVANVTDKTSEQEAHGFEQAKKLAQGIHFLAIQASPDSEAFAGFWLLQETGQI
ncbi:Tab2/Atab2 family RNA-binding protein [Synechocystis salina]|uniref:Tab2/Atab2 family RNA-binding protein n=1 Tax=Synechocystis salina LEGE 00031 TaxID=1828736 RepID=A0ABR9VME0_9SYNC|nr:Tab2/Atab2 family RNA-binding protein [Synechocystis salina]MBE9239774.1 Tab2/Atab2 family RNA-binding protein [Synechocystis salina LEGE 00041]MBE9252509.1 Tab2/Atab2 family RNA-binding protein [Synechocystis salina LEGE 00031]